MQTDGAVRNGGLTDYMKAIVLRRPGQNDAFSYEDLPDPQCTAGEVRILVKAAAVNRGEVQRRSGTAGGSWSPTSINPPQPTIVGWDVAGVIDRVGKGVDRNLIGQRVVALLIERGGYAEMAIVPSEFAVPIPANLTFEEAASLPVAYLTSWYGLVRHAGLHAGEIALIQAGTSGVGVAAIQIAKDLSAIVIATAGTDEKIKFCKDLGADYVINYTKEDFKDRVKDITGNLGVNVTLDCVGGEILRKSVESLSIGGRIVSVGNASQSHDQSINLDVLFKVRPRFKSESLLTEPDLPSALSNIVQLVANDRIKAVIDRTFHLSKANEAHNYIEQRQHKGKVVLIT